MDTSFGILGPTALRIGGYMVETWGKPRERRLLGALLAHPGRGVPIETLIAWIWGTDVPLHPISAIQTYATRIRKALERMQSPTRLRLNNGQFLLELDKASVDHQRFRELLAEARAHDRAGSPDRTVPPLQEALSLWRGQPLADLASARADAWRNRFVQNVWLPANALLVQAFLATERFEDALYLLDDLQGDHPYHPSLATLRMSTLAALDRAADVAAYYRDMHRHFRQEADDHAADRLRLHYNQMLSLIHPREPQPPVPSAPPPRQLLHDVVDFTGRRELLDAMDAATTTADGELTNGVVIVNGMAGVGKTALVTRWAHRERDRFPDGDLFVDMNGFSASARREQSSVVDDFLIALGQTPHPSVGRRPKAAMLRRALADRKLLVVLDNVGDAGQVAELVPLLADCLVVITSRDRLSTLATSGARRVHVEPMTPEEGDELMSRRLGTRVQVDRERHARMVSLCGGLPLAIEVLADHVARAPAAELSGFADRLDSRQLLTEIGEHTDGAVNLRALFSWSYLALRPDQRRLFCLLALHPGPDIGVGAVRACDGRTRAETAKSLSALVATHLLGEPEEFDRFRYHDLIREFAIECAELNLTPATVHAAGERTLHFYLASAHNALRTLYPSEQPPPPLARAPEVEALTFAHPGAARTWLDRERDNLTAAIRNPAYHGRHDAILWRLADLVTTHLDRRGFFESSAQLRRLAVLAARGCGDRGGEASSLVGLAMVRLTLGEHGEARANLEVALRVYEQTGGGRGMASTLHQLGRVEFHRGEPAAALEFYRRSLALAQELDGDLEPLCWVHRSMGEAYRAIDQSEQALVHLHDAKRIAQSIGDGSALGSSLAMIGSIYRELGDLIAAAAYCQQGLAAVEDVDLAVTAEVLVALAEITLARGSAGEAARFAQRAVAVCERTGDVVHEAKARDVLGDARRANAELPEAVLAWQVAADLYGRLGNPGRASSIQVNKIDAVPTDALDVPRARGAAPRFGDSIR